MLSDDEVTELLAITVPRLHRRLGPGSSPAFDVDDLVQDALERALALKKAGHAIESLPAWIQVVVLNLRRDEWRNLEAEARALARAALERPGVDVAPPAGDPEVLAHLENLPPRQREVLALHYYADMSIESIARRLEIDAGTVKSTLHRGRRALRVLLRPPDISITAGQLAPANQETPMPTRNDLPGWMLAGSHPHQYECGILDGELHHDKRVAYLRCVVDNASGFGTVMQIIDATTYRGTRVRLNGFVRSIDAGWCGLWMRVDESNGTYSAFDNMQERPIEGTTPLAPARDRSERRPRLRRHRVRRPAHRQRRGPVRGLPSRGGARRRADHRQPVRRHATEPRLLPGLSHSSRTAATEPPRLLEIAVPSSATATGGLVGSVDVEHGLAAEAALQQGVDRGRSLAP